MFSGTGLGVPEGQSEDSEVGISLSVICTERARPMKARKAVLVLPEASGFRELLHSRYRQDFFTLRAEQAAARCCKTLGPPGTSQKNTSFPIPPALSANPGLLSGVRFPTLCPGLV